MKLNPECYRAVLLYLEENIEVKYNGSPCSISAKDFDFDGILKPFSQEDIYYSVKYLTDEKLISVVTTQNLSPKQYNISDITPKGHRFINDVRSDTIWNKIVKVSKKLGVSSLGSIQEIAIQLIALIIKENLNI